MKFICLGYADLNIFASMNEAEMAAAMEKCFAYDDELRRGGHFVGGEALQNASQAKTMRYSGGRAIATDGPFAETKEQLGGILFLEAEDMGQAVELMSKHPGVAFGPFEIRPADEPMNALIKARGQNAVPGHNAEIEWLLQIFRDHLGYINQAVADISCDRFADQPNGLVNHPAWTLSHLNVSTRFLLKLLDDPAGIFSDEDQRRFGSGSVPTTNRDDYKRKEELLAELKHLHELTEAAVHAKHAGYFQRESPPEIRGFAATIGCVAFYLLASHEAYHLAQINQWRRAAGLLHASPS